MMPLIATAHIRSAHLKKSEYSLNLVPRALVTFVPLDKGNEGSGNEIEQQPPIATAHTRSAHLGIVSETLIS